MISVRSRSVLIFAVLIAVSAFGFSQTPSLPPEKVATVFGQSIHYSEAGKGPAVILLHGLGASKEVWMPTFGPLAAKYHVFAIDQIGFGHSDKPLLDYKIATFADFLYGFMQAESIDKATLVGNSLGGWIATDFAVQHPAMVDKLVLVDSAGIPWQQAPTVDLNPSSLAALRTFLESLFYDKHIVTDQFVLQVFTNDMNNNDGYAIQRTLAGFAS